MLECCFWRYIFNWSEIDCLWDQPSSQIQLNCLKQLLLKGIVLKEEIINQILLGCYVLEELSLIGCYDLHRLASRNPSIKSLILDPYKQTQRIEILCPNVELLDIAGFIDLVDVSSNAVSSLSFSYGFKCSRKRYQTIKTLFQKIRNSKMFTACTCCILVRFSLSQTSSLSLIIVANN